MQCRAYRFVYVSHVNVGERSRVPESAERHGPILASQGYCDQRICQGRAKLYISTSAFGPALTLLTNSSSSSMVT